MLTVTVEIYPVTVQLLTVTSVTVTIYSLTIQLLTVTSVTVIFSWAAFQ